MKKLEQPDDEDDFTWIDKLKSLLQDSTKWMLQELLPFLNEKDIEDLYGFFIEWLDQFFLIDAPTENMAAIARRLIFNLANRYGLDVTIGK
jgi:hypothetical protein